MLGRLMGYIYKNYRIHIIVVVIGIVVSVLANVQGTMFMKTLIDQYIMPLLKAETPDFHPLAMAILRVACFLCHRCGMYLYIQSSDDLRESGNPA